MKTTYRRIKSVKPAFAILRHLAEQSRPISGVDVSRACGIPQGTAMCHLVTLEDEGAVRRVGEHWELGMTMAMFWARTKSRKEADRARIESDIQQLTNGG